MTFADLLRIYRGRNIEVYDSTQLVEGTLKSVEDSYIVIELTHPSYITPVSELNVLFQNVVSVRVLNS